MDQQTDLCPHARQGCVNPIFGLRGPRVCACNDLPPCRELREEQTRDRLLEALVEQVATTNVVTKKSDSVLRALGLDPNRIARLGTRANVDSIAAIARAAGV